MCVCVPPAQDKQDFNAAAAAVGHEISVSAAPIVKKMRERTAWTLHATRDGGETGEKGGGDKKRSKRKS